MAQIFVKTLRLLIIKMNYSEIKITNRLTYNLDNPWPETLTLDKNSNYCFRRNNSPQEYKYAVRFWPKHWWKIFDGRISFWYDDTKELDFLKVIEIMQKDYSIKFHGPLIVITCPNPKSTCDEFDRIYRDLNGFVE